MVWRQGDHELFAFRNGASGYDASVRVNSRGTYQPHLVFGNVQRATATPGEARAWCAGQVARVEQEHGRPFDPAALAWEQRVDQELWDAVYRDGHYRYILCVLANGLGTYNPLVIVPGSHVAFEAPDEAREWCVAMVGWLEQLEH
ncbi:MAG: hypothetical protein RLZZ387_3413 [Chloroflexota bacterium]|jgi:hypothetical protein